MSMFSVSEYHDRNSSTIGCHQAMTNLRLPSIVHSCIRRLLYLDKTPGRLGRIRGILEGWQWGGLQDRYEYCNRIGSRYEYSILPANRTVRHGGGRLYI